VTGATPWQVRIALDPAEAGDISVAMHVVLSAEQWELRPPTTEDNGSPVLSIEVRSEKQEDAEKRASELYARVREQANLPPDEAPVLGALAPIFAAAPYERLLDDAANHIEHQRYELAVVRAQTACELYGKLALAHFARKSPRVTSARFVAARSRAAMIAGSFANLRALRSDGRRGGQATESISTDATRSFTRASS
jgi:hypothetical protein